MIEPVRYEKHESIGVIFISNPPVNSLSQVVRAGLKECFHRALNDKDVAAILITADSGYFCGGADIKEFEAGTFHHSPALPDLLCDIERSSKIVVAAIEGGALGGGLELALACDYRVAHAAAVFGLPEVKLGLIPGAGGTQRLPRITNPKIALEMIVSGRHISAERARDYGLVDSIVEATQPFFSQVLKYVLKQVEEGASLRKCETTLLDTNLWPASYFEEYLQGLSSKDRNIAATKSCVEAVCAACNNSFVSGLAIEQALFLDCMSNPQAKALQYGFFAERKAGKVSGLNKAVKPRALNKIAIVGAGTMGAGIAMNFINAGIDTVLLDMSDDRVQSGIHTIKTNYEISLKKSRLTREQVNAALACLHGTTEYADIADADLVIEAVFENLDIKINVFRILNEVCKPHAVLASNTSTLDVNAIASSIDSPERVIGLHFFSPANVMRLLEIVRADKTADDVLVTALVMAKLIKKIPVTVGVCFGFVGNRMLEPYGREATRLILEGARPQDIDSVLTDFGMAMGICAVSDLAGIDIGYLTRQSRRQFIKHDPTYAIVADKLYELGHLGQKSGKGFYNYSGRKASENTEVMEIARVAAQGLGVQQRDLSSQEILERCLFPLINEAAYLLEEGIAARPSDCDVIYVHGYGFPAWRGGPLFYADEIGLAYVLERLEYYRDTLGDYGNMWFTPAPLLKRLVAQQRGFKDLD